MFPGGKWIFFCIQHLSALAKSGQPHGKEVGVGWYWTKSWVVSAWILCNHYRSGPQLIYQSKRWSERVHGQKDVCEWAFRFDCLEYSPFVPSLPLMSNHPIANKVLLTCLPCSQACARSVIDRLPLPSWLVKILLIPQDLARIASRLHWEFVFICAEALTQVKLLDYRFPEGHTVLEPATQPSMT